MVNTWKRRVPSYSKAIFKKKYSNFKARNNIIIAFVDIEL